MNSDEQLQVLRAIADLRAAARRTSTSSSYRALRLIADRLQDVAGPLVRKRVASRLLRVSVQAIDRHVASGAIPVEAIRSGSTHSAIPTQFVIRLACEIALGAASLSASIAKVHERQRREREFTDQDTLNVFLHQIGASARMNRREAS